MEGICRSCLVKCNDTSGIYKYSETNRRLFVYSTGIQIKHDDLFVFQLCPECHSNMKTACKFKKSCRTSERKFKSYMQSKELEENIDFNTYIKKHDDSIKLRLPKYLQNSTPNHFKTKDDDNASTTTSMHNFLKDFLQDDIPDNEAHIINEVIREEADISDDSLDSHWLQDDASVISNLRLGFSPFSTHSIVNDHCYTLPYYDFNHDNFNTNKDKKSNSENNQEINNEQININKEQGTRCVIDKNLDKALLDESTDLIALEDLLYTPPMKPNAWVPSTPTINNILFGDKLDDDDVKKCGQHIEQYKEVQGTIEVLDEFLNFNTIQENNQEIRNEVIPDITMTQNTIDKCVLNINVRESPKESDVKENQIELKDQIENESYQQNEDSVVSNNSEEYNQSSGKQVIIEEANKRILVKIKRKVQNIESVNKKIKTDQKTEHLHLVDNKEKENKTDEYVFKRPSSPIENKFCLRDLLCKICNKKFDKSRFLKIHLTKKHNLKIVEPYKRTQVKRICEYCGYETKQGLRMFLKHIEQHNMNAVSYTCKHCKLTFSTNGRLIMHQNSHSGVFVKNTLAKQKKKVCDICGGQFTSSNYAIHMRRHNKDYVFRCSECNAGFYRRTDLTLHMRHHTGERPLSCSFCNRSFKKRDALNIHIKRHTGERPYKCEICGKTFTTISILKTHQIRSKECLLLQENLAFGDINVSAC